MIEDPGVFYRLLADIPEDDFKVKVSGALRLLERMLEYDPIISDLKANFDKLVEVQVPLLLESVFNFPTNRDTVIVPSHIIINRPMFTPKGSTRSVKMYPSDARVSGGNYSIHFLAYFTEYHKDEWESRIPGTLIDPVSQSYAPQSIFEMPVMLLSKYCHLSDLPTDRERQLRGELPNNAGGYFVVGGKEYFTQIVDQCRASNALIYDRKANAGGPSCSMTTEFVGTSMVTDLVRWTSPNGISIVGVKLKGVNRVREEAIKSNPATNVVGIIMAMAEVYEIEQIKSLHDISLLFQSLTRPEYWKEVNNVLVGTFLDALIIERDKGFATFMSEQVDMPAFAYFRSSLLPIVGASPWERIMTLAYMTIKYAEYRAGKRSLSNRDDWGNKRLRDASQLQRMSIRRDCKSAREKVLPTKEKADTRVKAKKIPLQTTFNGIPELISRWSAATAQGVPTSVTNKLIKNFRVPGAWGGKQPSSRILSVPGGSQAKLAEVCKIGTNVEAKAILEKARSVKPSQLGYAGMNGPQTRMCGLVKDTCITCRITSNENSAPIIDIIKKHESFNPMYGENLTVKVIVNGIMLGWTRGRSLTDYLIMARRRRQIHHHTCIYLSADSYLTINTDEGRPIRPLLVVKNNRLLVDLNQSDFNITELMDRGAIEYIDAMEIDSCRVARTEQDITDRLKNIQEYTNKISELEVLLDQLESDSQSQTDTKLIKKIKSRRTQLHVNQNRLALEKSNPFTHCEIHPLVLTDLASSTVMRSEFSQYAKVGGQSGMFRQTAEAQSIGTSVLSGGSNTVRVVHVEKPRLSSITERLGSPHGIHLVMVITPWDGLSIEDAMVINKDSLEKMRLLEIVHIEITINDSGNRSGIILTPKKPDTSNMTEKEAAKYRFLDDNGFPFINSPMNVGDCVFGLFGHSPGAGRSDETNKSREIGIGEEGIVHGIAIKDVPKRNRTVKVVVITIYRYSLPVEGGKYDPRNGQKTTIKIVPREQMPYTANGTVADCLFNPHGAKRMTTNFFIEMLQGAYALAIGQNLDSTSFEELNIDNIKSKLREINFGNFSNKPGYSKFFVNVNGQPREIESDCFIGPIYVSALKHLASSSARSRGLGTLDPATRQQSRGGSDPGFKMGRHDKAAMERTSESQVLIHHLSVGQSDLSTLTYCSKCHVMGTTHREVEYVCPNCSTKDRQVKYDGSYSFYAYTSTITGLPGVRVNIYDKRPTNAEPAELVTDINSEDEEDIEENELASDENESEEDDSFGDYEEEDGDDFEDYEETFDDEGFGDDF
jgi:DNA-directed RNA polymerase beta subunit